MEEKQIHTRECYNVPGTQAEDRSELEPMTDNLVRHGIRMHTQWMRISQLVMPQVKPQSRIGQYNPGYDDASGNLQRGREILFDILRKTKCIKFENIRFSSLLYINLESWWSYPSM